MGAEGANLSTLVWQHFDAYDNSGTTTLQIDADIDWIVFSVDSFSSDYALSSCEFEPIGGSVVPELGGSSSNGAVGLLMVGLFAESGRRRKLTISAGA